MAQRAETRETEQPAAEPDAGGRPRGRRSTPRPGPKRVRRPPRDDGRSAGRGPGAASGRRDRAESRAERARHPDRRPPEPVAEEASGAILGANPFVGVDPTGALGAAGRWLGSLGRRPIQTVGRAAEGTLELGPI